MGVNINFHLLGTDDVRFKLGSSGIMEDYHYFAVYGDGSDAAVWGSSAQLQEIADKINAYLHPVIDEDVISFITEIGTKDDNRLKLPFESDEAELFAGLSERIDAE